MPVVIFVAFVKVMILLKHYLLLIWLTIMRVKEYHGWCDGYGIISGLPSRANIQWRQWIWLCRVGWTGKFLISLFRYRYIDIDIKFMLLFLIISWLNYQINTII